MLRAVDELVADAEITDGTWQELAVELDRHQLMDLVFTVGAYDLLAMAFKSFGVELDDDLAARLSANEVPPSPTAPRDARELAVARGARLRHGRARRTAWSSSSTPRAS